MASTDDLRPDRYPIAHAAPRGFRQTFVHAGRGGVPLLLVHGWPETKRIFWRNVGALVAAGFEVIAPDLRGFGDSDPGPDGFGDAAASSRDLHALLCDHLGHRRVVVAGGDFGGPITQDLSLRYPGFVDRMVLFNSPLKYLREAMTGMRTRGPREVSDYYLRQGQDPDGLIADLPSAGARRRYVATFYTSRLWAHPGAFSPEAVDFMTEPFADAAKLRAGFRAYESAFYESARSEPALLGPNPTRTLILFGPSDHVLYPDFDRMAAATFGNRVGPFLLRDCGHFVPWEAAEVFNNTLPAFCADLLARRSLLE